MQAEEEQLIISTSIHIIYYTDVKLLVTAAPISTGGRKTKRKR